MGEHNEQDEAARLEALAGLEILDTPPIEAFDRLTRLVQRLFGVPVATIAFLDGHRQWFKSRQGLAVTELPRGSSFCRHTIAGEGPMIVPNAEADPRFSENPLVLGPPFVRFYAGAPIRTRDGHKVGTLCAIDTKPRHFGPADTETLLEFAGLVEDVVELQLLANSDPLTGALTRRALRQETTRAIALALRQGHDLGCIALDLDRFNSINDEHGHLAGDAVLVELVSICRAQLRGSDIIGRTGGEKFTLILPHAGAKELREIAERIREAIGKHPFKTVSGPFSVTASLGVAILDRTAADFDTITEQTDLALHRAQAAGRNRVEEGCERDKRRTDRTRVFKGGQIVFNGRMSTIDCTVRNLSRTGAGLEVTSSRGIPADFDLIITADGLTRPCRIIWKTDRKVGVAFR